MVITDYMVVDTLEIKFDDELISTSKCLAASTST